MEALTKLFKPEFLVGLVINVLAVTWFVSSRGTSAETAIADLKNRSVISVQDHEALIELKTDMKHLRERVDEIRDHLLPKKEAKNGK